MGHVRRNVLIAQTLARAPGASGLLCITGTRGASALSLPRGVDCLTLPGLRKDAGGRRYEARQLPLPASELIALRASTIVAALDAFRPDVFIVDKLPWGLMGELEPALRRLRARGSTRFVLGLRDVLDEPAAVRREWDEQRNEDAIRTYYDAVWIYGDRSVYDVVHEYGFPPEVAAKVRYTGYLDQCTRLQCGAPPLDGLALLPGRLVVCLVGGGEDGGHLAETFARADLPAKTQGIIVAGPLMPPAQVERVRFAAGSHPRMRVIDSLSEPGFLLRRADRIVAMGGYNTTCEVLSYAKPALIVPRVHPRTEQLIRAERLHRLGLIDLLHPADLTSQALAGWLVRGERPRIDLRQRIDLRGLERIPRMLAALLAAPLTRAPTHARPKLAPTNDGAFAWCTNGRASGMS